MPDLKLGQILATPDKGWQRIYNNNANFTYTGFASGGDGNFSSGYDYYTSTTDGSVIGSTVTEIRINFSGPRLRIINLMTNNSASSNKTYSVSVFIDGKNYGKLYDNPSANWVYKTVTFGVDDLSNGMHSLILRVNSDSTRFWFDSIDIGDTDNYGSVEKYNTTISYYFDDEEIIDFKNVKELTEGNHEFMIVVNYKGIVKIVKENLIYEGS